MATLDGKEVPQCVRCTLFKPDAQERVVTKEAAQMRSVLCDACAAITAETYPVSPSRQTARRSEDETPQAATPSTSRGKHKEE